MTSLEVLFFFFLSLQQKKSWESVCLVYCIKEISHLNKRHFETITMFIFLSKMFLCSSRIKVARRCCSASVQPGPVGVFFPGNMQRTLVLYGGHNYHILRLNVHIKSAFNLAAPACSRTSQSLFLSFFWGGGWGVFYRPSPG